MFDYTITGYEGIPGGALRTKLFQRFEDFLDWSENDRDTLVSMKVTGHFPAADVMAVKEAVLSFSSLNIYALANDRGNIAYKGLLLQSGGSWMTAKDGNTYGLKAVSFDESVLFKQANGDLPLLYEWEKVRDSFPDADLFFYKVLRGRIRNFLVQSGGNGNYHFRSSPLLSNFHRKAFDDADRFEKFFGIDYARFTEAFPEFPRKSR